MEVLTVDGAFANVPGAGLRGLLIALALKPGHVVPKATLVGWIWDEHPPTDATNAFSTAILVIAEPVMRPPSAPPPTRPRHGAHADAGRSRPLTVPLMANLSG